MIAASYEGVEIWEKANANLVGFGIGDFSEGREGGWISGEN